MVETGILGEVEIRTVAIEEAPMRQRWTLLVTVATCGILASCSGTTADSTTDTTSARQDTSAPSSSESAPTTVIPPTEDSAPPQGDGTFHAVITIGDEEFDVTGSDPQLNSCFIDENGSFGASVASDDLLNIVDIYLPPEGYQPDDLFWDTALPWVEITDADGDWWRANGNLSTVPPAGSAAELEEGLSGIDSFTFDEVSASGTATFVDWNNVTGGDAFTPGSGEPVAGMFEVTCG